MQKGQTPHAVGAQYAVGVSAKRSIMGDGDHYLKCKKAKPPTQWVHSTQYVHSAQ